MAAANVSWTQPEIPMPNIYPLDWHVDDSRFLKAYEGSKKRAWNPSDLPWADLDGGQFSREERLAIAYKEILGAMFEYAAAPQFLLPLHKLYEEHEEHGMILLCMATAKDEFVHEEFLKTAAQRMIPGFPFNWKPKTELEQLAVENLRWVEWKQGKMWPRYREKILLGENPWLLQVSIMAPEIVAMEVFRAIAENAPSEALRRGYKNVDTDEARHVAFGRLTFEKRARQHPLSDEAKRFIAKLASDGIMYSIAMNGLPGLIEEDDPDNYWLRPRDLMPPRFLEIHRRLLSLALKLETGYSEEEIWERARPAVRKVKWVLEQNGIKDFETDLPVFRAFQVDAREKGIVEDYSLAGINEA